MSNHVERVHIEPTGDKVTILHGDLGKVFQYEGTRYKLRSMQAVVDLVKIKGTFERTVIFYNPETVEVILDDSIIDRPQDRAVYRFEHSDAFKEWQEMLDKPLTQKDFVDFLRRRPDGEVFDLDSLLAAVQKLRIATQIVGEFETDDINNVTVVFKSSDTEDSVKLPRTIYASLALLNESDFVQHIEIELEWRKPRAENERPVFLLSCPKLQRYMREAVDHEVAKLKEALPGYLIVAGKIE